MEEYISEEKDTAHRNNKATWEIRLKRISQGIL